MPDMLKRILGVVVICGAMAGATEQAHAQAAVACVNCSSLIQQLMDSARQAQQLATQVSSYQTQLRQYSNMVTNTISLPQQAWSTVQADIMQVRALTDAASLLSGNSGSILSRLNSASAYAGQVTNMPANIGSQFSMWQQTLGNAETSLGRTLGVQRGYETNYTALQQQLQMHSQTAAGQMQAIQAGNELAALTSTQLNQIQATLTAQAQLQATQVAVAADRQATEDAATYAGTHFVPMSMTGNTRF